MAEVHNAGARYTINATNVSIFVRSSRQNDIQLHELSIELTSLLMLYIAMSEGGQ